MNGKTLITGVYELNSDKDFDRKSYKKEKFDVFCKTEPWVKKVDGTTYGHYGFTKNKTGWYSVTYLPAGFGITAAHTEKEAKLLLKTLEDNRPELPLIIKAFGDEYRCYGINRELVTDIKGIIESATESNEEITGAATNKIKLNKNVIEKSESVTKTKYNHLYDEEKVSKEYLDSVNPEIENAIIGIRNDNVENMPDVIDVTELNENTAKAISELVGFDVSGYKCKIESDRLVHIEKRHGINGEHDQSLSDPKDTARLGYVVNNSDNIDWVVDSRGNRVFDKQYKNKDNKPSPVLILSSKIDGTYCVSQAVPDSKKKTVWITSARIQKAAVGSQVPHGRNSTPWLQTPETPLDSSSASGNIISQTNDVVNSRKKLYDVYNRMKDRCYNSKSKDYKYYGEKGVKIDRNWIEDFEVFYKWALENGYRQGLTIDRINPYGDYEPSNCRWITMSEQNKNKRADNDTANLTDKCTVTKTKHTATGNDIWVVTLNERISTEDFKKLLNDVKSVGGYYSKATKTLDLKPLPGFVFKTEPTAKEIKVFNDFFGHSEETSSGASATVEKNIGDDTLTTNGKGDIIEKNAAEYEKGEVNSYDESGKTFENDERHSKMQDESESEAVQDRGSDGLHSRADGGNDGRGYRNISQRTAKSEERALNDILDGEIIEKNTNKESTKNVHDGLLERESGNDNAIREPEIVSEVEEERNVGPEDRELGENVTYEDGTHIQAPKAETSSAGQLDSGNSDNGIRESDDSYGNSGTGIDRNDNDDVAEPLDASNGKSKDFVITKAVAENIDTSAPSMDDNIKAIETLHAIENSGKAPTKTQQGLLAKFKGWGGLTGAFYGANKIKLQELMSDGELKAAQSTVNDAYFTPTNIIDGIYKALNHLGFEGGNVLEPSMGVGNFFGRMPKAVKDNSSLFGVEIDSISGRIAQQLYPSASIEIAPFQDVAYKDGAFDLIIGNVPFGEVKYKYKGKRYLIHDYFFVKAMDKLNDGGILVFLTTKGTLDKLDSTTRTELSNQGKIIGAYRLPSDVFTRSAGASVVTDLIIMQKTSDTNGEKFVNLGTISAEDSEFSINEYFVNHPENIIGKITSRKDWRSGKEVLDVVATGNVAEQLVKAIKKLPKNLLSSVQTVGSIDVTESNAPIQTFTVSEKGDVEYINAATGEVKKIKGKAANVAKDYVGLKNAYQELIDVTLNGYETNFIEDKRKTLNTVYDGFVKKYGSLEKNKKVLSDDNDFYKMSGLEVYDTKTKKTVKSEMFTKDTLGKRKPKKADTVLDALSISIGETGGVDLNRISELTGISESEAIKQLVDRIIYTPDGVYELNEVYLSGNVREKYEAVKGKKGFEKNEQMLKAVIPEDIRKILHLNLVRLG